MGVHGIPPVASDALRSELIFLPDDGSVARVDDGLVILMPSRPTFWWGNTLHFDRPPADGDFARWTALFATHVRAAQPASTHTTFGWDGDVAGTIEPFLAAGFDYLETIALAVDRDRPIAAPWPADRLPVVRIAGDDWASLLALQVETRDEKHPEADHVVFIEHAIARWRALEAAGRGCWFGVRDAGRIVAALGIFVEARRGPDGRRVGRFQQVVTHPAWRRRGLAGTLVAHASRHAFDRLDADTVLIFADENDVARRVYEACGYRIRSRQRGLERGAAPT